MTLREKVEQFRTALVAKGETVSYSEAREMFLTVRDLRRSARRLTMNKLWKIQDCVKNFPDGQGIVDLLMHAKEL